MEYYNRLSRQRDRSKNIILNLKNVFLLLSSLSNFIRLALLNNIEIFYNNKNKILYNINTKEVLAYNKK